jgi:predicted AlkP superfamily phosphohydrolase/phosphomutase
VTGPAAGSGSGDGRPAGRRRQLVVGLDAMEWSLIERWAEEGKLPTLAALIRDSVRADLRSTSEQLPDTVWAALYTGCNPGKLAKYFYVQYDPESGDLKHLADDVIEATPVWEHLSRAGVRVGVVDMPKFRLATTLNGFQLTNWGAHATKTARASYPPELLGQVEARFGPHPVGDCDAVDDKPRALAKLKGRILEGVHHHGELFRWLMREQEWDVFMAAFSEPHCIGHHFWQWVDPTHPNHGEEDTHGLADAMEQVYRAVDSELGRMLELLDDDARVILVAGHGMGPIYHASWNLPDILGRLGYGAGNGNGHEPKPAETENGKGSVNFWRTLKMVVPGRVQYAIKGMLPQRLQDELLFRWYAGSRDWRGHRAFAVPNNDSVGAIRVAVKGRDRYGVVEPGEEYERICRDLADAFEELTDPATGRKVVKRVTLTHEEFEGPHVEGLPDVTVLWDQTFEWHAVRSPRFGTLEISLQDSREGSHSSRGFALLRGPGLPGGTEIGGSLYDIAPTVLEGAGVPVPDEIDGEPLTSRIPSSAPAA